MPTCWCGVGRGEEWGSLHPPVPSPGCSLTAIWISGLFSGLVPLFFSRSTSQSRFLTFANSSQHSVAR